ncbi:uncharacterized protein LOC117152851 isoform X2 [Anabas testudineus]|uniref:uncharacterized protein LOC117152851 isoform X2 n=1 Tax=Anabas testudineus TaxID=64144 RepID=UPI00143D474C|nr:uncharacterized protein LOC117152851 isoform X2 [Anabas testudineus]
MDRYLLLVFLMYNFSEIKSQALQSPKLTVNPAVITETDSVTLTCQPPSSVSVTQCYFYFMRRKPAKTFSCLKRLTGSEILMMTNRNSSATVEVTCFYLVVYQSPESSMSSITIIHSPQTVGVPSDPDNSVSTFLTSVNPTPGDIIIYSIFNLVNNVNISTVNFCMSLVTGEIVFAADTLTSADSSLLKPTSDDKIRVTLIRMIGAVMIVVVVLLGLTILFNKIGKNLELLTSTKLLF